MKQYGTYVCDYKYNSIYLSPYDGGGEVEGVSWIETSNICQEKY